MPVDRKYERDIDLFLAEEFSSSATFADWFLRQTPFADTDAIVHDVFVGQADSMGESDLVVLFQRTATNRRFALLIEDKIDAPFQPGQEARYRLRGESEVLRGNFDSFAVVLCAPDAYRREDEIGQVFDAFVSYEKIAEFVESEGADRRTKYRAQFIRSAASRTANLWVRVDDETTNEFWRKAYTIASKEFALLEMKPLRVTRGSTWVNFRPHDMPTMPQRYYISFKGDRGQIDLTFTGSVAYKFEPLVASILDQDMTVHQTGKSTAVRIQVEGFQVNEPWSTAEPKVRAAFSASERLIEFFRANRPMLSAAASQSVSRN